MSQNVLHITLFDPNLRAKPRRAKLLIQKIENCSCETLNLMSVVVCSSCSEDNQHNTERPGYVE